MKPEGLAYAVASLIVVVIGALVALGHPVPEVLSYALVAALGGGAGVSVQRPPGAP